jgi:hypothetical protein
MANFRSKGLAMPVEYYNKRKSIYRATNIKLHYNCPRTDYFCYEYLTSNSRVDPAPIHSLEGVFDERF